MPGDVVLDTNRHYWVRKRDAEGKTAVKARPQEEWLRVDRPELRIVSEEVWNAAHRRLGKARVQYDQVTHGQRRPRTRGDLVS